MFLYLRYIKLPYKIKKIELKTVSASKDYFSEKNYLTIREIIGLLAYPAKGRMNLFISEKKKEVMKIPKRKLFIEQIKFLQSSHKETQYAVETIAKATTILELDSFTQFNKNCTKK